MAIVNRLGLPIHSLISAEIDAAIDALKAAGFDASFGRTGGNCTAVMLPVASVDWTPDDAPWIYITEADDEGWSTSVIDRDGPFRAPLTMNFDLDGCTDEVIARIPAKYHDHPKGESITAKTPAELVAHVRRIHDAFVADCEGMA